MRIFYENITTEYDDLIPHVRVKYIGEYNLDKTLDCGQAFRWERVANTKHETEWIGVACGRLISVAQDGDELTFYNVTAEEFHRIWCHYFALDEDYDAIDKELLERCDNPTFRAALEAGKGIRILHQEPWEAICSFIISQNNNIPRIKKIIEALCESLGSPINALFMDGHGAKDIMYYSFPTAKAIFFASEDYIFSLKTGFRAKYIIDAAQKWMVGEINEDELKSIEKLEDALAYLCRVKGIGLKVASCALLFGFERHDPFPVDVWMRRVLEKYFEKDFDPKTFGRYAGVAQQYLFDYERSNSQ
jgi:N-glycosylase/DNA lyase